MTKVLFSNPPCYVDDAVFRLLNGASVYNGHGRSGKYFAIILGRIKRLLHRYVFELYNGEIPVGLQIDHIDGNPNNNTISNLRVVTPSVNQANRGKQKNNTSGFKGVHLYKPYGMWMAKIKKNGKSIFLGYFADAKDAAMAVNKAYAVYFPEVSPPNKI